jgi:MoxR-like ATPase
MRLEMGYPSAEEERAILHRFRESDPLEALGPVITDVDLQRAVPLCRQVFVHQVIEQYIVSIARASRQNDNFALGVSPRGTMALYRTSQALAALRGRNYVLPDDVQYLASSVLVHRLIPSAQTRLRGRSIKDLLAQAIAEVPVPVEESWSVQP